MRTTTEHSIIISDNKRTWTCGPDAGYVERFAGTWHASHEDHDGDMHAPEGHGRTPEDAVRDLLDAIAEASDNWPEDFDRDR